MLRHTWTQTYVHIRRWSAAEWNTNQRCTKSAVVWRTTWSKIHQLHVDVRPPPPSTVRGFILSSLTSGPSGCETTAACRQTSLAARLFNHSRAVVMCAECGLALSCLKKKSSHFAEMLLPNLFYRSALMAPSQMCRLPRMPCRSKPLHIIQSAGFRRDRFGGS